MADKKPASTDTGASPGEFLKVIKRKPCVVKLNSGVDYRGILVSIDGYMNVAMEQTEEYVDGQLQNQYGDAFIRGNNVLYISASKEATAGAELASDSAMTGTGAAGTQA